MRDELARSLDKPGSTDPRQFAKAFGGSAEKLVHANCRRMIFGGNELKDGEAIEFCFRSPDDPHGAARRI
jgi:hypothetical protein